jgi:membrane protein required for colicin V production
MPIDIICVAVFAYGCWQGYNRGIIGTIFNLLAYVFGTIIAFKVAPLTTDLLERLFNSNNPAMYIAAIVVNLLVIFFILRQAANGMESILEAAYLGQVNRMLGALLTGGFMVLVFSVLLWFVTKVEFISDATLAQSRTYPVLEKLPLRAKEITIRFRPLAETLWEDTMRYINRLDTYKSSAKNTEAGKPKIYEIPDDGNAIEEDVNAPDDAPPARIYKPQDNGTGIEE